MVTFTHLGTKVTKFPIWIKANGKWELIPYSEMTTFEDGTKGYVWSKTPPEFVKRHKRYFRCTVAKPLAMQPWRIIFSPKPRWIWRPYCRKLALPLLFLGGTLEFTGIWTWWPLMPIGIGVMVVSLFCNIIAFGNFASYLEDQL